jgi:GntR family transcriptional regulator
MIVSIDINSSMPLYEQLKSQIITGILNHDLKEGEQLPSVRQLSSDLDINMHTVAKVYKILENEGFIVINKKKGAFIHVEKSKLKLTYEREQLFKEIQLKVRLYQEVYESLEVIKTFIDQEEDKDE